MLPIGRTISYRLHGVRVNITRNTYYGFRIFSPDTKMQMNFVLQRNFFWSTKKPEPQVPVPPNPQEPQSVDTSEPPFDILQYLTDIKEKAPKLYEILNWPQERILKDYKTVRTTLTAYDDIFVDFLEKLLRHQKYNEIVEYYEKFGIYNNMEGKASSIYLTAKSSQPEKVGSFLTNIFKNSTSLGLSTNPMYVRVQPSRGSMIFSIIMILAWFLLILYFFSNLRGAASPGGILTTTYHTDKNNIPVKFADVMGNNEAKEELQDLVHFLRNPQKFANVKIPKGVLMVGPPGTGKTLMARALAGEAGVSFLSASGSEFEEVFVGVGARRIRQLFEEARKKAPCIVFIDEIDALGVSRASLRNQQMSLNQLLVELDGFNTREGIILVGATNLPSQLDPALIRPGRFDRKVYLELPTIKERKEILDYYLAKYPLAPDVDSDILSRQTPGMSGADIENMVNWAILEALKGDMPAVDMNLLEVARMNVVMGREKKSLYLSDNTKKITAYHEGGHALASIYTDGAEDINKATLIPRGQALGYVEQVGSDEPHITKKQLLARIQVAMAGRAAEEFIFGPENVTAGAASDFEMATKVAKLMVTEFGMSNYGHMYLSDNSKIKSQPLHEEVQKEIKKIIEDSYQQACTLLREKETELHRLAKALLKYETLDKQEILKVLSGKPLSEKDASLKELEKKKKLKEAEKLNNKT